VLLLVAARSDQDGNASLRWNSSRATKCPATQAHGAETLRTLRFGEVAAPGEELVTVPGAAVVLRWMQRQSAGKAASLRERRRCKSARQACTPRGARCATRRWTLRRLNGVAANVYESVLV
jgi:hypothetical protein